MDSKSNRRKMIPTHHTALQTSVIAACLAFGSAANAALTFNFDFTDNTPGIGFLDPISGGARQQALFTAASLFGTCQ